MQNLLENCYCQPLIFSREDDNMRGEFSLLITSLAELKKEANHFLHSEELIYFKSLTVERRQHSYLLSRFTTKAALNHYGINAAPTDILIAPGVFQFPVVYLPQMGNIQISDSHCYNVCVAIVFPEAHPMGIDLEIINSEKNAVIETQLTTEEINLIKNNYSEVPDTLYTLLWTMKEALSKILHTGLTTSFEIFQIKNLQNHNEYWTCEYKNFMQYQAISFQLGQYICTIAYPRRSTMDININAIQHWFQDKI